MSSDILDSRLRLHRAILDSPNRHGSIDRARQCGEADAIWWINNFVWAEDPRLVDANQPVGLWTRQPEFVRAWLTRRSIVVDKSRDWGISLLGIGTNIHQCIHYPGRSYGLASRSESEVWDGTTNSIFGKGRYLLRHLPPWMAREVADIKHMPPTSDAWPVTWCLVGDPPRIMFSSGSSIIGRATSPDVFRGPRYTRCWVDEASVVPQLEQIVTGALGSGSPVSLTGTPRGRAGYFARLIHGETGIKVAPFDAGLPGFGHLRFHYRDDPRKTPEVLAALRATMDDVQWAQEEEIDYSASTPGRIWPEFNRAIHAISSEVWDAILADSWRWRIYEAWDTGLHTAVVWTALDPKTGDGYVLDSLQWYDPTAEVLARDIAERRTPLAPDGWRTRSNPRGRPPDHRVGDPACAQPKAVGRSWRSELGDEGIVIESHGVSGSDYVERLQRRVRMALAHKRLRFAPDTGPMQMACDGYRRQVRPDGTVLPMAEKEQESKGGLYSHPADALQYACDWMWPRVGTRAMRHDGNEWVPA